MKLKKYLKLTIVLFGLFGFLGVSGVLFAQDGEIEQPTEVDDEGAVKMSTLLIDNFETYGLIVCNVRYLTIYSRNRGFK